MPAAWPDVFRKLAADPERQVRSRAMALALTFGDPAARQALAACSWTPGARSAPRQEALAALLQVERSRRSPPILQRLIGDPGLGGLAVRALSALRRSGNAGCAHQGDTRPSGRPNGATP